MPRRRTGRKATEGNTNGASCAGVVTALPQSSLCGSRLVDRCVAPGAYRRAITALESPKEQLHFIGHCRSYIAAIGGESDGRWPATREVNSGSTCTVPYLG